jgi:predicted dehydrogenase
VAAIADSSEKAISAATAVVPDLLSGAERFTDGELLLQAAARLHLDAVLLLTPPEVTPHLLRVSSALGLAVFAEKPVSEEVATLAVLAEAVGGPDTPPVQIGYNRRWQPLAPAFRERIFQCRTTESSVMHVEAHLWRAARSEAIFYRDTMIHAVDFLLWCLGPLELNRVTVWPSLGPGGIASGLRAEMKTTDETAPVTVHLDVRPSVGRSRESYLVLGDKTGAELTYSATDPSAEPAHLWTWDSASAAGSDVRKASPCPAGEDSALWERGFLSQMAGFLSLVGGGSQTGNHCGLSEALAARQLTDAILSHQVVPAHPEQR